MTLVILKGTIDVDIEVRPFFSLSIFSLTLFLFPPHLKTSTSKQKARRGKRCFTLISDMVLSVMPHTCVTHTSMHIQDGDEDAIADLPSDGGQGPGGPHVYSLLGTGSSAGASGGGGSGEWSGALPGTTPKRGNGSNVPQARRVGGSSGSVRPFSVFRTEENLPSTNKTDERVVTLKKPDAGSSYGFTLKTARSD